MAGSIVVRLGKPSTPTPQKFFFWFLRRFTGCKKDSEKEHYYEKEKSEEIVHKYVFAFFKVQPYVSTFNIRQEHQLKPLRAF